MRVEKQMRICLYFSLSSDLFAVHTSFNDFILIYRNLSLYRKFNAVKKAYIFQTRLQPLTNRI